MKTQQLLAMIVLVTGCPAVEKTGEMQGGGGVPPRVQMIFDTYCQNNATCHISGGAQAPNLSPSGSAQGIQGTSATGVRYVVPGDTANSFLAQKILPGAVGQMPPIGNPQPTPEEVAIILGWIAGAPFPEGGTDTDTSDTMMATTMMMPDMGMEEPQFCALDVIDPAADVGAAVDAGDTATQIPTVIGDVLVRNCGCHYVDMLPMDWGAPYTGPQGLATLADFQGDWMGSIPGMLEGMPAHAAISARIDFAAPMPPLAFCDADGEPAADHMVATDDPIAMTQEDYDLLQDWLGMGAPDGATYEPPA